MNKYKISGLVVLAFVLISFVIGLASSLGILESFRIVFGSVFVLFLPGFVLSYLFFSNGKIDEIERIALSFALSIAVVPLVVFYLNLIDLKISLLNSFLTVLGIIILGLLGIYYKTRRTKI